MVFQSRFWVMRRRLFTLLVAATIVYASSEGTIFGIVLSPSDIFGAPTPEEVFMDLQLAFASALEAGTPLNSNPGAGALAGGFMSKVDVAQDLASGRVDLIVCELEPFWERGAIVYRLQDCPLSKVKVVVYSLVPAVIMFFTALAAWSRHRNVRGRGKETQITSVITLGISLLSTSYDWFFSWTLFRNPRGKLQNSLSELGLAHLIGAVVVFFFVIHFWFRRKFLVGIPWYEFHKHGIGLHLVFLLMYVQPQSVILFQSRLFDLDLFHIHFASPSKMNEVLSSIGCLSLLQDIPQFIIQIAVYVVDTTRLEAPRVTPISMALSLVSIGVAVKRQYIASVERQWYEEIVRMAGVRKLTAYGGGSQWLKLQKRPSAAADTRNVSTQQQQLFLAWMQSMGRRQESIVKESQGLLNRPALADKDEEDSEDDLDSLSDSEEEMPHDEGEEGEDVEKRPSGDDDEGRGVGELSGSEGGSGSSKSEGGTTELQSYSRRHRRRDRKKRFDDDVAQEGSTVISSLGGLMDFARNVAMAGDSESGVVSESDIMAFAKRVAGQASVSGVHTESYGDLMDDGDADDSLLRYARNVASADSDADTSLAGSDVLAFARQVAKNTSESGVGTSVASGDDIFAFARRVAADEASGVSSAQSDGILTMARQAAEMVSRSGVGSSASGAGESDIFEYAKGIAQAQSTSGASAASSVLSAPRRPPKSQASSKASQSALPSIAESDIFAAARRMAAETSKSGVSDGSSAGSVVSDIFALARKTAAEVSMSGASAAGSVAQSAAGFSDIFGKAGGIRTPIAPGQPPRDVSNAGSEASSDWFGMARREAANVSASGVGAASQVASVAALSEMFGNIGGRHRVPSETASAASEDIMAIARQAAADASVSGAGVSDASAVLSRPPPGAGRSKGVSGRGDAQSVVSAVSSTSDLFAIARRAADDAQSGVTGISVCGSGFQNFSNDGLFGGQSVVDSEVDFYALARATAAEASRSGAQSEVSHGSRQTAGLDNIFAPIVRPGAKAASRTPEDARSNVSSDIFGIARRAAEDASQSGVQSARDSDIFGIARQVADSTSLPGAAQSGRSSHLLSTAMRAAAEVSVAGVSGVSGVSSDLFGAARRVAADASGVGDESSVGSDLFGAALQAAAEAASRSGVGSSAAGSSALHSQIAPKAGSRRGDFEFAPRVRRFASEGSHGAAPPPLLLSPTQSRGRAQTDPTSLELADQPPWVLMQVPGMPPPPSPPSRLPPLPPGDAPPLVPDMGVPVTSPTRATDNNEVAAAFFDQAALKEVQLVLPPAPTLNIATNREMLRLARDVVAEADVGTDHVYEQPDPGKTDDLGEVDQLFFQRSGAHKSVPKLQRSADDGVVGQIQKQPQHGNEQSTDHPERRYPSSSCEFDGEETQTGGLVSRVTPTGSRVKNTGVTSAEGNPADAPWPAAPCADVDQIHSRPSRESAPDAGEASPNASLADDVAAAISSVSAPPVDGNSSSNEVQPSSQVTAVPTAGSAASRSQRQEMRRRAPENDSRDYKRKHSRSTG